MLIRHRPTRSPSSNELFLIFQPQEIRNIIEVLRVSSDRISLTRIPELYATFIGCPEVAKRSEAFTLMVPSSPPVDNSHGIRCLTRLIVELGTSKSSVKTGSMDALVGRSASVDGLSGRVNGAARREPSVLDHQPYVIMMHPQE